MVKNVLVSLSLLLGVCMVSCNSDAPESTDHHVDYTITLTTNEDFLSVADITISYYLGGEEKVEAVTTSPWAKTITYSDFPCIGGIIVKRSFKKGVTLDKDKYDFLFTYQTDKNIVNSKGNIISKDSNSRGRIYIEGVDKDEVETYIKTDYTMVRALFSMQAKDGTIVFSPVQ